MTCPIVVRIGSDNTYVRVDRGTDWGNPFIMYGESTRNDACDKFEAYAKWRLSIEPKWLDRLRGKNLACWCAPKRCHAETLLRLANEVRNDLAICICTHLREEHAIKNGSCEIEDCDCDSYCDDWLEHDSEEANP